MFAHYAEHEDLSKKSRVYPNENIAEIMKRWNSETGISLVLKASNLRQIQSLSGYFQAVEPKIVSVSIFHLFTLFHRLDDEL